MSDRWPVLEAVFLAHLAESGNVSASAKAAGVNRQYAYERRAADPEFAKDWDVALETATDALEAEARRRAMGWEEEQLDDTGDSYRVCHKHSDTLLIFLLKAHRPSKFRDNVKMEVVGKDNAPLIQSPEPSVVINALGILASLGFRTATGSPVEQPTDPVLPAQADASPNGVPAV